MNQWIDVKERKPSEDEIVMAVNMNDQDPEPLKARFINRNFLLKEHFGRCEVTHWMPLPELPPRSQS